MSEFLFYREEREEHRLGLGKYAGQMEYVSAFKTLTDFSPELQKTHPTLRFISEQCDNLNLVEDQKGLFCNYCCHYHARFTLKGLQRVYQPIPQKGYDTPEQTCLNPGKYRSDWTGNDVCFEDPYGEDEEKVNIEPGEDFWYRVGLRVSKYHMKVEV